MDRLTLNLNLLRCNKVITKFAVFIALIAQLVLANIVFAQSQAEITWPLDGKTLDPADPIIYFTPNDASEIKIALGSSPGTADIYDGPIIDGKAGEYPVSNIPTDGQQVYLTFSQRIQAGEWIPTELTYSTINKDNTFPAPPKPPRLTENPAPLDAPQPPAPAPQPSEPLQPPEPPQLPENPTSPDAPQPPEPPQPSKP